MSLDEKSVEDDLLYLLKEKQLIYPLSSAQQTQDLAILIIKPLPSLRCIPNTSMHSTSAGASRKSDEQLVLVPVQQETLKATRKTCNQYRAFATDSPLWIYKLRVQRQF